MEFFQVFLKNSFSFHDGTDFWDLSFLDGSISFEEEVAGYQKYEILLCRVYESHNSYPECYQSSGLFS